MSDKRAIRRQRIVEMKRQLQESGLVVDRTEWSDHVVSQVKTTLNQIKEGNKGTRKSWIDMIEKDHGGSFLRGWAEGSGTDGATLTTFLALGLTEDSEEHQFPGKVKPEFR